MADVTVAQLAETIETPVERLLQQMQEAGLSHENPEDLVSDEEKQSLLAHRKKAHGDADDAPTKITLKRRTLSTLKTAGAAGRGRTVNVEVRKKRTYVRRMESELQVVTSDSEPAAAPPRVDVSARAADEDVRRRAAHAEAEAEAERRKQEAVLRAEQLAEQKAKEEEERLKADAEKAEPAKPQTEKELEEARVSARKDKRDRHDLDEPDVNEKKSRHGNRKRRVEELLEEEVVQLLDTDVEAIIEEPKEETSTLVLSTAARSKRPSQRQQGPRHQFKAPTEDIKHEVEVGENITVAQLSQKMSVKANAVIKALMNLGIMANLNQSIDQDTATLVVEEFGHKVKLIDADQLERALEQDMSLDEGEKHVRAPVVTVMGHVDHGKTSLLDYIRKSKVVSGEAGGITQHIGAYRVKTPKGEICFIDTPGHAAFTAMRARGAECTDIVILVVAADDGVMPQTEEAIQHARGAGVPIVVAINKMDVEGADAERVKSELSSRGVQPDDWGGDTQFVKVSALTGDGIEDLLEAILLQAELLELTAVFDGPARGVVIESQLDRGKGPVATLLIQNGTLKQGDIIVAGTQYGRVRAISDEHGASVKSAGPATPVQMQGLDGTPAAGDPFLVAYDERRAREVAEFRRVKANDLRLISPATSLDTLLENFGGDGVKYLNIVVKADVRGSLEAIVSSLRQAGNDEVKVNVVFSGVGAITESDANYALTSGAVMFGFNVRADSAARKLIEAEGLDLRYYKVIYDLVDDVKAALSGMLSPEVREDIVGIAQVKDVFQSKKFGSVAGCIVVEGTVFKNKNIRVLRDHVVIFEGELESLRRFKDEVNEVRNGTECGIGVRNYNDVRVGDQIEVFDTREVARKL